MSLPAWQATIVKDNGDVLPGAEVTIVNEATGLNATIYSDRAGTVGKSNPFFADAEGFAQFYAAPGEYRITAVEAGSGTTRVWRYVVLTGTAARSDVTTSATDTTAGRLLKVGAGYQQLDSTLYRRGNILGTVSQSGGVPTGAIIERGSNANGEYVKYADGTIICTRLVNITGITALNSIGAVYLHEVDYDFPHTIIDAVKSTEVLASRTSWIRRFYVNSSTTSTADPTIISNLRRWSAVRVELVQMTGGNFPTGGANQITILYTAIGRWY